MCSSSLFTPIRATSPTCWLWFCHFNKILCRVKIIKLLVTECSSVSSHVFHRSSKCILSPAAFSSALSILVLPLSWGTKFHTHRQQVKLQLYLFYTFPFKIGTGQTVKWHQQAFLLLYELVNCISFREELRLWIEENRLIRHKIYLDEKRKKAKLNKENIMNKCFVMWSIQQFVVPQLNEMDGSCSPLGQMRNAYTILLVKPHGKKQLGYRRAASVLLGG